MKNIKGFTLIELLIVVAILGVLVALIVPNLISFIGTGDLAAANTEVNVLNTAITAYIADYNGINPESMEDLEYYIKGEIIGEYEIEDGTIVGIGGWDRLEWQDHKWVKTD